MSAETERVRRAQNVLTAVVGWSVAVLFFWGMLGWWLA